MEVFVGGGAGQADGLLALRDGRLVDLGEGRGPSNPAATYGAVATDLNNDGDADLAVARNDGVYLCLNDAGSFHERKLEIQLEPEAVAFSIAVADINRDGFPDLYISVFIDFAAFKSATFNDPAHAKHNLMLLNNGDLSFTDVTAATGTGSKQNTFLSVFTDLDGDGRQDLVVAQNTGEIEIFRSRGDLHFEPVATHSAYGYWMGLAVGDIDNDGDQDLFFSNISRSIPDFLVCGDLRDDQPQNKEWLLLRNDGDFKFADATARYGLTGWGFGWGAVFEDLNLDGRLDLLVAQNYIKWTLHKIFRLPGKAFLQTAAGRFRHDDELGLNDPYYGQSPLIADLDGDGRPDVVWLNMDGPVRAFLNRSTNNFLAVALQDNAHTSAPPSPCRQTQAAATPASCWPAWA